MKRLPAGEYRMMWNVREGNERRGFPWGWFWGIACVIIGVVAGVLVLLLMGGASVMYVETECFRDSIHQSLELSEEEARRADWQAYYRDVLASCQLTEEPSDEAARFMKGVVEEINKGE